MDTLTAPEQRVLGALIEKRFTTPDQYPLTLNALRLACNQSTNRDPVTGYDEETINAAAQRLSRYGLTRLASGHSSRATKYRHLAGEALGLTDEQLAILAVLLLRGAQTPGELKGRSERMAAWESLAAVERVLGELIEHGYARRLERRPGQKEERFVQTLGDAGDARPTGAGGGSGDGSGAGSGVAGAGAGDGSGAGSGDAQPTAASQRAAAGADRGLEDEPRGLLARIEALERRVAALEGRSGG